MEQARPAGASDVDSLTRLWHQALAELDGQRGGDLLAGTLVRPDVADYLERGIADPDRYIVVGLIDEVPVGLASVVRETDRREVVGHLELMYVEPPARQIGVAEHMLELVSDWCGRAGCVGIDAPALPGNRAAKTFFEGKGFQARMLVMHYPLSHDPA